MNSENQTLLEMYSCLEQGEDIYLPSRFWQTLNEKNLGQLRELGFENFKQTLAQNCLPSHDAPFHAPENNAPVRDPGQDAHADRDPGADPARRHSEDLGYGAEAFKSPAHATERVFQRASDVAFELRGERGAVQGSSQ